jgi:hypothetical protein
VFFSLQNAKTPHKHLQTSENSPKNVQKSLKISSNAKKPEKQQYCKKHAIKYIKLHIYTGNKGVVFCKITYLGIKNNAIFTKTPQKQQ